MKRKTFLQTLGLGLLASKIGFAKNQNQPTEYVVDTKAPFTLPKLAYSYNALEPNIDAITMEIHYTKHHQAYVNNLNKAVEGTPAANMELNDIIKNISKYSTAIRNNGGGHWNHSFFWEILSPKSTAPSAKVTALINNNFGSLEKMQTEFNAAATSRFGSGWAWLVLNEGKLKICSTPNQDNPMMDIAEVKGVPLLGLDVWEHAYYLKYQNKRADYVKAFWNIVNWNEIENKLDKAY